MTAETGNNTALLALDTSGDVCSVAVLRGGLLVSEHTFRHGMHLSERLLDDVSQVLNDAATTLANVDALAIGMGPGSFTGTRIGVMTLKTWADALSKPLYGVGSLDALAMAYAGLRDVVILTVLPCRAETVFAEAFTVGSAVPVSLASPAAVPLDALPGLVPARVERIIVCGAGVSRHRKELQNVFAVTNLHVSFGDADIPRAAHVAHIAHARRSAGQPADDPTALVPLYIAPPPISQPKPQNRPPIPQTKREQPT